MTNSKHFAKPFVFIAILLLNSCKDKAYEQLLEEKQKVQDSINKTPEGKASHIQTDTFETIIYDGCEYLIYKEQPDNNKAYGFMAHKGNCMNPIHKFKSE